MNIYALDTGSGKLSIIDKNVFGGFSGVSYDLGGFPDFKWIAYPRSLANHLHALFLYSVETGRSTQVTDSMADSRLPAFDRNGKYLYFTASTNAGATSSGLDMSADLYEVRSSIYALVLAADQPSPVAPELNDEKAPAQKQPKLPEPDQPARGNEPTRGSEWRRTPGASGAPGGAPASAPIAVKVDL